MLTIDGTGWLSCYTENIKVKNDDHWITEQWASRSTDRTIYSSKLHLETYQSDFLFSSTDSKAGLFYNHQVTPLDAKSDSLILRKLELEFL